ncbi:MAG: hypothetical protein J3R72DRAFT_473137 [Linnemannia gamsii]|nr:MAG: hypothetical protein J3R72DRAFT_473137 [Linnemannia gamsii]
MTLLDRLNASQPSRIVNVSSMAHRIIPIGGINFDTLTKTPSPTDFPMVYVNTLHPGYVRTSIGQSKVTENTKLYKRMAASVGAWVIRKVGLSPREGALTQLYLGTSPEWIFEEGILYPLAKRRNHLRISKMKESN